MPNTVLGLDLGPNSVGWALISEDGKNPDHSKIIDLGVRVFTEGVDAFDTGKEKSRNEDRRNSRGMRRQVARRARRTRYLKQALIDKGLFPKDSATQEELLNSDPYELRARALDAPLTPHEIGRVLLHLNQRRGFLSNRKKDRGDSEVKGMLAEISELAAEIEQSGARTFGEYLHRKRQHDEFDRVRNLHTRRDWFEDEFAKIWDAQQPHHKELLTNQLRYGLKGSQSYPRKPTDRGRNDELLDLYGLHGLIFFQRTMYWPKSVVGLCELESKEKRCPRGDRRAQLFRLLQEINNLRYVDPDSNDEQPLDDGQRQILIEYLSTREKASFDQLRKKLGFMESVRFNLERGKRPSIKGMVVDHLIAKRLGKEWHSRVEGEKDAIVALLLKNEHDDQNTIEKLQTEFGFTLEEASVAIDIELPDGYGNLSLKAISKLLPHLERGLIYQSTSDPEKSAIHAAGYLRRDELQRRLFDQLPDPAKANPRDCKLGDIPNPVVKRALVELKKVVNSIIREYGKPDAVHVELARNVQQGREKRSEYNSRMRDNETAREAAAEAIRDLGYRPTRDSILLYRLWDQQNHECLYCGKTISQQQLFGSDADIDHILPKSRSLDDAQTNKVVCHRACNHDKGQKTPHEWLASSDPEKYNAICQRAAALLRKGRKPYAWYRRFRQKELELDTFIARQLTDTGYISRATVEYLRLLFENDHAVLGLKGQLTSELRWQWGLDTVLQELPDSPGWQDAKAGKLRVGEKNRADHRHHAIDAVVVALTNRSRLQKLSKIVKKGGAREHGEILFDPWEGFREDVKQRIAKVNVSHRVERKVCGALHEETLYGPTENEGEWVVRKNLIDLSASEIERIRDKTIRELVVGTLKANGIEVGRGKKPNAKKLKELLADMSMPSGVPIKKVRIIKPEQTIQPLRDSDKDQAYVKPGSTHHLAIFEIEQNGKTKRDAVFVTMLEATKRLKAGQPIIQRTHPNYPEARFVMSLSSREMVLADWKGKEKLLMFKTAPSTSGQMRFAEHTDSRKSSDYCRFTFMPNTLNARKVTVDPLGRIRWAND